MGNSNPYNLFSTEAYPNSSRNIRKINKILNLYVLLVANSYIRSVDLFSGFFMVPNHEKSNSHLLFNSNVLTSHSTKQNKKKIKIWIWRCFGFELSHYNKGITSLVPNTRDSKFVNSSLKLFR